MPSAAPEPASVLPCPNEATQTTSPDFFLNADGRAYHVGCKPGDVEQRIITCGDHARAERIARAFLEPNGPVKTVKSTRGFSTFTGTYKGVGVSVVAIGMGSPMMDFFVREISYANPNPLAVIRLGTCGGWLPSTVGKIGVASEGCVNVITDHCAVAETLSAGNSIKQFPFFFTKPILPDDELNRLLVSSLTKKNLAIVTGKNVSAEYFYATQGRPSPHFDDGDFSPLHEKFHQENIATCEMETYVLFDVARRRKIPCKSAACHVIVCDRSGDTTTVLDQNKLHAMELEAAECALDALCEVSLS